MGERLYTEGNVFKDTKVSVPMKGLYCPLLYTTTHKDGERGYRSQCNRSYFL